LLPVKVYKISSLNKCPALYPGRGAIGPRAVPHRCVSAVASEERMTPWFGQEGDQSQGWLLKGQDVLIWKRAGKKGSEKTRNVAT